MVRRSVPASSRWVAKLCRRVWTVTCFSRPEARRAWRQTFSTACGGDRPVGVAAGEEAGLGASRLPVGAEERQQPGREHDVAVLVALALADVEDHALAVDVLDAEVRRPRRPAARRRRRS